MIIRLNWSEIKKLLKNLNATTKHKLFGIFLGSLLLGAIGTNWYLQQYQPFLDRVYLFLQREFRKQLGVNLQARVARINFLQLSVDLEKVVCIPVDKKPWSLQAQKLVINCSLLTWLYSKKIGLALDFKQAQISTKVQKNNVVFFEYLKKLFANLDSEVPFVAQSVQFIQSVFELIDTNGTLKIVTNGQLGYAKNRYTLRMYLLDGVIKTAKKTIIKKITGITNSSFYVTAGRGSSHSIDLHGIMPGLPEDQQSCTISGSFADNAGALVMHNDTYSFHIDPLTLVMHKGQWCIKGLIKFPACLGAYLAGYDPKTELFSGNCLMQLQADNSSCSGTIAGTGLGYGRCVSDAIIVPFSTDYNKAHGIFEIVKNSKKVSGLWETNFRKKTGELTITNNTDWVFDQKGYWAIPAGGATVSVLFENKSIKSHYDCVLQHAKTEMQFKSSGKLTHVLGQAVSATGFVNDNSYDVVLQLYPIFKPLSVSYKTAAGAPLIAVHMQGKENTQLEGSISYDYIKTVARELFDYELSAAGAIEFTGHYHEKNVHGTFKSKNGLIRVPELYNFVTDCSGAFMCSFDPFCISVNNTLLNLHKGKIQVEKAEVALGADGQLEQGALAMQFHTCFLHWKNEFFALVSGNCSLQKQKQFPYELKGVVTLEKGQLKENPLSQTASQELTNFFVPSTLSDHDVVVDLIVKTKEPLFIKTPQLHSRAEIDVTFSGTLKKMGISGGLILLGGEIQFPYQSLYITRAQVHCLKDQPYDPLIDLTAQGMIKKYMITLVVSGSIQHPHITLSSMPLLTEEQIISLLFTGSSYESLSGMIPALVMHSIESYLFGAVKKTKIDHWFDPLKHIRIIPSFADQTGRGGFKGAIEVDVSDHLHAKLQKNFSLSEDTAVEIEYLVSDEVSIKGTKDERSDIGAEIEMRFKF